MTWLGVASEALAVVLFVLGLYNVFRTVVLDLRGVLKAGEGFSYVRTAAVTLGIAAALYLTGATLRRVNCGIDGIGQNTGGPLGPSARVSPARSQGMGQGAP